MANRKNNYFPTTIQDYKNKRSQKLEHDIKREHNKNKKTKSTRTSG